jgi:hypothetical protein
VASNSNQVPTITLNSMMDRLENIKFWFASHYYRWLDYY